MYLPARTSRWLAVVALAASLGAFAQSAPEPEPGHLPLGPSRRDIDARRKAAAAPAPPSVAGTPAVAAAPPVTPPSPPAATGESRPVPLADLPPPRVRLSPDVEPTASGFGRDRFWDEFADSNAPEFRALGKPESAAPEGAAETAARWWPWVTGLGALLAVGVLARALLRRASVRGLLALRRRASATSTAEPGDTP